MADRSPSSSRKNFRTCEITRLLVPLWEVLDVNANRSCLYAALSSNKSLHFGAGKGTLPQSLTNSHNSAVDIMLTCGNDC